MTYDKENQPINKPYEKKPGRPSNKIKPHRQMVKSFIDTENIENNVPETRKEERQPFKPISI